MKVSLLAVSLNTLVCYFLRKLEHGSSMQNDFSELKLFQFLPKVDPCDPTLSKGAPSFPRVQQHGGENKTPGKSKAGKAKGKGKKTQEDDRLTAPVRKLWYEARSPEGYTYYWHIETNGAYTFVESFYLFRSSAFCISSCVKQ